MNFSRADELQLRRRAAESRCHAVRHRLISSSLPAPAYLSLLRLLDAELRSLSSAAAAVDLSSPLSSNVGYLECIARVLLHPSVSSVSRVAKPIPSSSDPRLHVDVVCTLGRCPAWFFVSDRNPSYISWFDRPRGKGLRSRVERVLAFARSAGSLKPAFVVFVFSRGVGDDVAKKLVDEFGAAKADFFGMDEEDGPAFEEMEDGWVGIRPWTGRGRGSEMVFEIKVDGYYGWNEVRKSGFGQEADNFDCSDDKFGSLISKMNSDSSDSVNFDTTALVALVSGISNGGCELLMKAPEAEMRTRFKGNYVFVMDQVTSELVHPIIAELEDVIAGKKGIVCESAHSEFRDLVLMCGGPNEKFRADQLIKHLRIVPDSPSARVRDLPTTRKIAMKNKSVFGTGDHWHAPTLTANMGFVRAVSQTSMSLLTIEHRPRALTGD